MIKGLEHVGIRVRDMERSLQFYQEVLGLQLRSREKINEKVELAFLFHPNQPDMEVELIQGEEDGRMSTGRVHHLAFLVENMEDALAKLKGAGVKLEHEEPQVVLGNIKIAFFEGPDGEVLELMER